MKPVLKKQKKAEIVVYLKERQRPNEQGVLLPEKTYLMAIKKTKEGQDFGPPHGCMVQSLCELADKTHKHQGPRLL